MLSICIPSKTERFLYQTTKDILEKATGEIEVFPILDGYDLPPEETVDDPRVHYVRLPTVNYTQKRHGLNQVINNLAKGKYVASCDAHCMFKEGFDEVLVKDLEDDWIAVPRRNRLDAENWCLQPQSDNRPPIDYEYVMYPPRFEPKGFHGFKWDEKTLARQDIMIDDVITMQASFWIMNKSWYQKNDFMQIEGFTGWGQEAESLCFKTWMRGGRCFTRGWPAHLTSSARRMSGHGLRSRSWRRGCGIRRWSCGRRCRF